MQVRFALCVFFLFSITAASQQLPPNLLNELHWRNIGPFRGGRTRAATGVPSQPNVFYVGQVNGGVWQSDDYGRTWNPIFDDQPTQSIGAIAIAPSDPDVVYVASGEGLQRPDLSVGDGIYKSTDAGHTWTHLGLRDGQQIPALVIDPRNPDHLFAAVLGHPYGPNEERGVLQSGDGGRTWQKSLYVDQNTGASDVALDPLDPNTVYAALWEGRQAPWEFNNAYAGTHGGIYKSTDSGQTWRKLAGGLPANIVQAYIAIAAANPRRIYATVAIPGEVHIYRSDDAGATWTLATEDTRPAGRIGGGDLPVPRVDPKNPDVLYSTSIVTWRSEDAGKTWTAIKGAPGGDDYQNIWINPVNPDIILLVSDQGALVSVNRGRTWSSWYNQPTAQLYHVASTSDFPYKVCAGQQESGSVCISSRGNDGMVTMREWHPVGIIEYGYAAPDPLNPDIVFGAGRGQVSKYHVSTGQTEMVSPAPLRDDKYRADRTSPIIFSPAEPHTLYYATNVIFKTTDGGHSWQSISPDLTREKNGIPASLGSLAASDQNAQKQRGVVYSLAPSFFSAQTLWAGTDEGLIRVTRDGGAHWINVTPKELTPWSKVTQLEAGHYDDLTAYASVSRFRIDDLHPYIYRTHDGGKTWTLITNGLPEDAPADTVREDPVRKGLLFAGTEKSVWFSLDDGDHWQSLQLNLPHTSMRDLWIKDADLIVATHGRSFWILDGITPLRQIDTKALAADVWLAKPAQAWRVRENNNTDTPIPPDEAFGENPPDGALIDYFLREKVSPVKIEILDTAGKVVRAYSSDDEPEISEAGIRKLGIPAWWVEQPKAPSAAPGLHRWVWDIRYTAPEATRHEYPIAAVPGRTPRLPKGPRALPGIYTVRLTAGGKTLTSQITVKMDPRIKTPPPALRQNFQLEQKNAALMTSSTEAIREARGVLEQIAALKNPQTDAVQKETREALTALTRSNGQASTLYNDVGSADTAPTAAELAAASRIARDLAPLLERWEAISDTDIPALNQKLKAAGLPEIKVEENDKHGDTDTADDDDDMG